MIEWDEMMDSTSEEDLLELKHWLFRENIRLQSEQRDLDEMKSRFIKERDEFRKEMDTLNHQMVIEHKRLKDEQIFFDKKMDILKNGFMELEAEKQKFNREKLMFENNYLDAIGSEGECEILFSGVTSSLGLKKRYKDLMKIYHPDNLCGSEKVVQLINREYDKKRAEQ
ncbi:hypothetical protein SAMN02910368_00287 [Lachnospiraceae bacterium G11]|jgi:hypothetical protein|nr:hypothetical protein SAMN02910368_00287 [Lachnospiraceae bacterium G11]